MSIKQIKDRVIKSELVKWKTFEFIQSEKFKHLSREAHDKLKNSIIDNNFVQTFKVWEHKGKLFCLDGFHRCSMFNELIEEGYSVPERFRAEFIGWKKGKTHFSNKFINNLSDVFNLDYKDFQELFDVWYVKRDATQNYVHPTQKPVRLPERAINKNSKENDIILDFFGGSGSTLIGCDQMKRRAFLMELDPKYCDVIVKRYIKFCTENNKPIDVKLNGKSIKQSLFE